LGAGFVNPAMPLDRGIGVSPMHYKDSILIAFFMEKPDKEPLDLLDEPTLQERLTAGERVWPYRYPTALVIAIVLLVGAIWSVTQVATIRIVDLLLAAFLLFVGCYWLGRILLASLQFTDEALHIRNAFGKERIVALSDIKAVSLITPAADLDWRGYFAIRTTRVAVCLPDMDFNAQWTQWDPVYAGPRVFTEEIFQEIRRRCGLTEMLTDSRDGRDITIWRQPDEPLDLPGAPPDPWLTNNKISHKERTLPNFTAEELAKYDGQNGQPAYIAYQGKVYDISAGPNWSGGDHLGHVAGVDLTDELDSAPHGEEVFEGMPVVGEYVG
jgi:predicted heme/steroid binding protein